MDKVYLTVKQLPKYKQISFEDMLSGVSDVNQFILWKKTGTITRLVNASDELQGKRDINSMVENLHGFVSSASELIESDLSKHYNMFKVPKKSGGWRQICAPDKELSRALKVMKGLFESFMPATYHTSAFAYITNRSTIDEREVHQRNQSEWFSYFDFHDFFGSTTPEFVMNMLKRIYPFNFIVQNGGEEDLRKALSLAFLNGGLPQGTPFSPLITNIMMIPFDHIMTNTLHKFPNVRAREGYDSFIYTRYADDICISCGNEFDVKAIQEFILQTLVDLNAPFTLNTKKTKYQSRNGKNFHLGVILNKNNEITLGHEKKRRIKAMISNYMMDKRNGKEWSLHEIQVLNGQLAYFHKVEPEMEQQIIRHFNEKFGRDVLETIHEDLIAKGNGESLDMGFED